MEQMGMGSVPEQKKLSVSAANMSADKIRRWQINTSIHDTIHSLYLRVPATDHNADIAVPHIYCTLTIHFIRNIFMQFMSKLDS